MSESSLSAFLRSAKQSGPIHSCEETKESSSSPSTGSSETPNAGQESSKAVTTSTKILASLIASTDSLSSKPETESSPQTSEWPDSKQLAERFQRLAAKTSKAIRYSSVNQNEEATCYECSDIGLVIVKRWLGKRHACQCGCHDGTPMLNRPGCRNMDSYATPCTNCEAGIRRIEAQRKAALRSQAQAEEPAKPKRSYKPASLRAISGGRDDE